MKKKTIIIENPETIQKLYRIGAIPQMAERAEIHPILAAYLAERGVLEAKDVKAALASLKKSDKLAEDKLAVIRHLWSRGYICRFSLEGGERGDYDYIRVHRKGVRPGEDRTQHLLKVIPKNWKCALSELLEAIEFAGRLRKELILAYVEEKEVRFLRMGRATFE